MYESSVPVFIHFLNSLSVILKKAEEHCVARKIDPQVMLGLRLSPDMFPLSRQVQIASDAAKGAGARLSGIPVPSYPDEEKTFEELQARIARTIDFLQGLDREPFAGAGTRAISLKAGGREMSFTGAGYLETWAKPNFFFHLTTAYAILRHAGVELGKSDFLAGKP